MFRHKRLNSLIAYIIFIVMLSENVMAVENVNLTKDVIENIDIEHNSVATQNAVEVPTVEESEIITNEISTSTETTTIVSKVPDMVLSEDALDFELDTKDIPEYAVGVANSTSNYSSLNETDRFYLNRYICVREDTMFECEGYGLNISQSIPMALLMQRLEIDYNKAAEMVVQYCSQAKALEAALEYRNNEYNIGFLSSDEVKPELTELLIEGYDCKEIINSFSVAKCLGIDIKDAIIKGNNTFVNTDNFDDVITTFSLLLNPEEAIKNNVLIDDDIIDIADKYNVKAEKLSEYMKENQLSIEDVELEILSMQVELGVLDENKVKSALNLDISTYSNDTNQVNDLRNNSDYKEGPFSYRSGENDDIDIESGILTYTDNILSLPGINDMDFNLSLRYFSKTNYPRKVDKRANVTDNWQFSFPYLVAYDGGFVLAHKEGSNIECNDATQIPMFIILSNGVKYPIEYRREGNDGIYDIIKTDRHITGCKNDDMYFNLDYNSKGGLDSCFEVSHMDGTMDYFNNKGQWISTVNRFGNTIKITEYT